MTDEEKEAAIPVIRELTDNNLHMDAHALVAKVAGREDLFEELSNLAQVCSSTCGYEPGSSMDEIYERDRAKLREWVEAGNGGDYAKRAYEAL